MRTHRIGDVVFTAALVIGSWALVVVFVTLAAKVL